MGLQEQWNYLAIGKSLLKASDQVPWDRAWLNDQSPAGVSFSLVELVTLTQR